MKQKIRFRMRFELDPNDPAYFEFAICPEEVGGVDAAGEWMRQTGLSWWPVVGRVSQ